MIFDVEFSAAIQGNRVGPVSLSDELAQTLLAVCETRGWSLGVVLHLAIAAGVRELQRRWERPTASADSAATDQADRALSEAIARLCVENARLCAENARLHDWVEQCRTGRAPGIPTVDAPSPAWLWRYRPFR